MSDFGWTAAKICDFVKWLMFHLYWSVVIVYQPRLDTNVLFLHWNSSQMCRRDGVVNRWFPQPGPINIVPLILQNPCNLCTIGGKNSELLILSQPVDFSWKTTLFPSLGWEAASSLAAVGWVMMLTWRCLSWLDILMLLLSSLALHINS